MKPLPLLYLLAALGVGCGPSQPRPVAQKTTIDDSQAKAQETPSPTHTQPEGLSDEECQRLFNHIFDIANADVSQDLPDGEKPIPADIAKAKDLLRDQLMEQCVGAKRGEFAFDCAMAASNSSQIQECMSPQSGNKDSN